MALPPLNLNLNTASSADGRSQSAFDNSGFVVNVGGKNNGASGVLVAALVIGAVLWLRRKG